MKMRVQTANPAADPYAAWAESYPPRAHNPLMEVEQAAVLELLPSLSGLTVLDAGCGTGRYTRVLEKIGAARVVGLDRSEAMLRRGVRGPRIRGDLRQIPLANASFDVVVSGLALSDVADPIPVVREWARVLRRGGILVCSTLHPRGRELGWTRTFETSTGTHTLPAFWHTLDDYRVACHAAGLSVEAFAEPSLASHYLRRSEEPVALILRARRTDRS